MTSNRITRVDLDKADVELKFFLEIFQKIYGLRFVTLNFHLLRHLAKCVRKYGPLWTVSCFPFENANGWLVRCITGTHNVFINMVNSALALSNIRKVYDVVLHPGCAALVREYLGKTSYENCFDLKHFGQNIALSPSNVKGKTVFLRAIINEKLIESESYTKNPRRNNCVISTKKGFMLVEFFFFFESAGELHFMGKKLVEQANSFPHPNLNDVIKPMLKTDEHLDLNASLILGGPLLMVEKGSKLYCIVHGEPLEVN